MDNKISNLSENFFDYINFPKNLVKIIKANSLTQEFKKNGLPFVVKITFLGKKIIYDDELKYFNSISSNFYVREVYLLIGDLKIVRSRSICYLNSKYWINFLNHNDSLGNYLFDAKNNISRSKINFFWLYPNYPLLENISKKTISRRSYFINNSNSCYINDRLLLTECFLDDLIKLYR